MLSPIQNEGRNVEGEEARWRAELGIREMVREDLWRVLELRSVVRWSADPRAFDLLRGIRGARWAVADAPDGSLAGMVGAVPLGEIGILCQLAVREGLRGTGLGGRLSSWAVGYLRSRGARTIRLYATREAERLYDSRGFRSVVARAVYTLPRRRVARAGRLPGEARERYRVSPLVFGDLPELFGVDLWSYGADRSALILATLRLHPGWGLIVRDTSSRIKGYLVRSSLGPAMRLGPLVAESDEAAGLLVQRALETTGEDVPVEVTVPGGGESPAHALLERFGFEGREDRLRMELGAVVPLDRSGLHHYGTTPYLAT